MIKKIDILIILVILIIAGIMLFFISNKSTGSSVVLSHDGEEIMVINLSDSDKVVDLNETGIPAKLELLQNRVRFIDVSCPDHLCEKVGFISKENEIAVCMPNKLALTVK